jgi:hypothetical protein
MNKCSLGVIAVVLVVLGLMGCAADSANGGGGQNNGTAGTSAAGVGAAGTGFAGTGLTAGTGAGAGTAGTTAGTGPVTIGDCKAESEAAEVNRQGADIVWVVDNSCSMADEAEAVRTNMNRFAQKLIDEGVDVRLVLISATSDGSMPMLCPDGDWQCLLNQALSGLNFGICIDAPFGSGMCPADSKAPNYLHVPNTVGSWDALVQIINSYPMYSSMMRPDAAKHFVVVTDDESTQMDAATFTTSVAGLDPTLFATWKMNAIYAQSMCPAAAAVGNVYKTLIDQTGGVGSDLCSQDFDPVFDALAQHVAQTAEIACDFPIPPAPAGQTLDPRKVNVRFTSPAGAAVDVAKIPEGEDCNGREGWYYDNDQTPTKVISCEASCTSFRSSGGRVEVLFGCDSVVVE